MDFVNSNSIIQLKELCFKPYLSASAIQSRVVEIGQALREQLQGETPVFLIMLKGAFIFGADLVRASGLSGEIDFVRTSSYIGTESSKEVKLLLAPNPELVKGRHIVLIEDIIDSGYTMQSFLPKLNELKPASVTLVALLHKPEAVKVDLKVDHIGFDIPNKFVVGYGLDYDGLGRQLDAIYQLVEE